MTAYETVRLARSQGRINGSRLLQAIIDDFHELHGDRLTGDDPAIIGGLGYLDGQAVTVLVQERGRTLEENERVRFGMPMPEGYRKAIRLMRQAEKFGRPVITLVDTPGAYPGIEAENRGQAAAIAECLATMLSLRVPTLSLVIGEGGSGGALALAVADRLYMMEHSVFSVISPEACASILFKDPSRAPEAAEALHLQAADLHDMGICDGVFGEAGQDITQLAASIRQTFSDSLKRLRKVSDRDLPENRYRRYRKVGMSHVFSG
ncbi:carboxyltransferase subunit alpha [Peptococcus simiae]|uniref:acetyl-CoA carboxytransferase n=1 Tax=Peptococcus simiae TaxID=1643805 RepID=A0ABW9GYN2_9FIRM